MNFNIKSLHGSLINISKPNTDFKLIDTVDYTTLFLYYLNKKYSNLYKISIKQFITNIELVNTFLPKNIQCINDGINSDKLMKIRSLLNSSNLPESVTITGYKYTNIDICLKIDLILINVINILDDLNEQMTDIILNNNEKEASIRIDDLNKEFEKKYLGESADKKFFSNNMISYGFQDKNININNKEYFRNQQSDMMQINITKDEYYNIYRSIMEYKKYSDNLAKYRKTLVKMGNNTLNVLYNKSVETKFNNLSNESPLKASLTRLILNEGRFIGGISVFVCRFISFQTDAINESLAQNIEIINAINRGTSS